MVALRFLGALAMLAGTALLEPQIVRPIEMARRAPKVRPANAQQSVQHLISDELGLTAEAVAWFDVPLADQ